MNSGGLYHNLLASLPLLSLSFGSSGVYSLLGYDNSLENIKSPITTFLIFDIENYSFILSL